MIALCDSRIDFNSIIANDAFPRALYPATETTHAVGDCSFWEIDKFYGIIMLNFRQSQRLITQYQFLHDLPAFHASRRRLLSYNCTTLPACSMWFSAKGYYSIGVCKLYQYTSGSVSGYSQQRGPVSQSRMASSVGAPAFESINDIIIYLPLNISTG